MELMHQLTPQLKRLRLSGILETLEIRNQQAIDEIGRNLTPSIPIPHQ